MMRDGHPLDELLRQRALLAAREASAHGGPRLQELRLWQAARLMTTYADLRRDPRCADAIGFFLSDVYGLSGHARRDQDLERAAERLERSLPEAALRVLVHALELQLLTAELDQSMAAELGAGPIDWLSYATAYRKVGRAEARRQQIELVLAIGKDLESLVARDWMALALRAARAPAVLAGYGALHDFLYRGFAAFRKVGDPARLLRAISDREGRLSAALFSGAALPAEIVGLGASPAMGG